MAEDRGELLNWITPGIFTELASSYYDGIKWEVFSSTVLFTRYGIQGFDCNKLKLRQTINCKLSILRTGK